MKALVTLLTLAVVMITGSASALTYTCTGAPVVTGTAGSKSASAPNAEYLTYGLPWAGEDYSFGAYTNYGGPAKLSFGAASGAQILTGGQCFTSGTPCAVTPVTPPWTNVTMSTTSDANAVSISRLVINGTKVMEIFGLAAVGSIQLGQQFDAVARIRQDTGANSIFFIEGYYNSVWKSVRVRMVSNQCGSISLNEQRNRNALASLGFELMPSSIAPKQWWMG